jgi:hypothetical protein
MGDKMSRTALKVRVHVMHKRNPRTSHEACQFLVALLGRKRVLREELVREHVCNLLEVGCAGLDGRVFGWLIKAVDEYILVILDHGVCQVTSLEIGLDQCRYARQKSYFMNVRS